MNHFCSSKVIFVTNELTISVQIPIVTIFFYILLSYIFETRVFYDTKH